VTALTLPAAGGPAAAGGAPRMSVVICVYTERRWDDILAAIDSVRRQTRPPREIIVVADHNPALLRRLEAEFAGACDRVGPPLRVVRNGERRGLSGAKNTGVARASGDVVAFLDDDAVAEPDWLRYLAESYSDERVAGVGGLTRPRWDKGRPGWFPREFDWVVGCSYLGMPAARRPVRNLLGGNASFRAGMFSLAGGFTSEIGRSAASLPLGCEETEFCIRLGQCRPAGRLLIDDRAVIWHRVPAGRGTFSYFLTRCYAEGLSKARVSRRVGTGRGLSAERRHVRTALPAGVWRGLAAPLRGDLAGPGRAGAIMAGLASAAAGYANGLFRGGHDGDR